MIRRIFLVLHSSLKPGACPSASTAAASKAAAAEASSAATEETSPAEDDGASAASAPVVVAAVAFAPGDHVSAVAAQVGHFLGLHAVVDRYYLAADALQLVLAAVGALACRARGKRDNEDAEDDETEHQKYRPAVVLGIIRAVVLHRTVQPGASGADTGQHAFAPASVLQVGYHVAGLDALADGVG